jgi:hypothetical protein
MPLHQQQGGSLATKEELEVRASECESAGDFAALAKESAVVDADYAQTLLDKAEM